MDILQMRWDTQTQKNILKKHTHTTQKCWQHSTLRSMVIYPHGCKADWELLLPVTPCCYTPHVTSPEKGQNSKSELWFLLNEYCLCTIVQLNYAKQGTLYSFWSWLMDSLNNNMGLFMMLFMMIGWHFSASCFLRKGPTDTGFSQNT